MKAKKSFLWGLVICVILTVVFTHSILLNLNKPLSLDHWDAFIHTFILKHYHEVIFQGRWDEIYTSGMFYGFKNSQFYSDPFITQAILSLPFYLFTRNPIITYNLLSVLTLILSAVSMYIFVYFLTKKALLGVLGAVIFTFNPFTLGHFPDQLQLYSLQWIPMIFLFLERSFKDQGKKNIFLFFVFLTIQLFSSLYYVAFLSLILPIYGLIRIIQNKLLPKKLINLGTILGLIIFGVGCWVIISLYSFLYTGLTNTYYLTRIAPLGSAYLSDYFFTTSQNWLYGREEVIGWEWEHSLFWGITPIILFLLSFFVLRKNTERKLFFLYLGLLILSFLISFGPQTPLYTLIYYLDPLFHNIRAPVRMGMFVFFFLTLIIVLTAQRFTKMFTLAIILLILIEYFIKPFTFADIPLEITQAYLFLNTQNHIKVIMEYPIASNVPVNNTYFFDDLGTQYLLYAALFHNKKIINGSGTFFPYEYQKRIVNLNRNFPTKSKIETVKGWGTDAIILHREEFKQPKDYDLIRSRLISLQLPVTFSSENLTLFDLTKWVTPN